MDNEQQVATLIQAWAAAAHDGDLVTVLADHAPGIVMFDVSPPNQGVRGIEAYRDTWPPFFQWQASGAVFQIESLDVTADAEVAFADALLRCGTPADLARDPGRRLRLTLGLRKVEGRWTVTHEHHSFPDTTPADPVTAADPAARP
jgi:ketosteroid isomerase-like protein